jgi:hypothetical protein
MRQAIAPILLTGLISACAIGPQWNPTIDVPTEGLNFRGKQVVVSNFIQAQSTAPVKTSIQIEQMLKAAEVQDISLLIANELKREGIPAEAVVEFSASKLTADQVWLRGAIVCTRLRKQSILHYTVFWLTLVVVGGVLPSPFPLYTGADITYRAEFIDHTGKILVQTGDLKSQGYYKNHYYWAKNAMSQSHQEKITVMTPVVFADAIKKFFK